MAAAPQIAESALRVPHSRIREIAELAMTMDGVYKLYFGESNLPTPALIKQAAVRALEDGYTFYTSNAGLPSLRAALSEYYSRIHQVWIPPDRFVITASGVQALNVGIRCVLNPGEEAIVLTPAWPNGSAIVRMCNALPVELAQVLDGTHYAIDFDALERSVSPRTRLLIYTSPSNPLGWVATESEQRRLLEFARRHKLWLMADEVYERLYYRSDGAAPSILRLAQPGDATIVVQSFSKAWCMTGWRVGWIVSRPDLCARATALNEFIISHASSFAQRAAETALAEGDAVVAELVNGFKANRDYCAQRLLAMRGVTLPQPDGAFYLFPRLEGLRDSFSFCKDLLLATKVGLAPGVAFGSGGEGSVRICYASDRAILEPALDRLDAYLSHQGCTR